MTTVAARKELGQFWTPEPIARAMVRFVTARRPWRVFLDPAVGPGIFVQEALSQAGKGRRKSSRVIAYDLDASFRSQLESHCMSSRCPLDFRCEDFLLAPVPEADAIVCNPPYMKHHFVREKARAFAELDRLTGVSLPRTVSVHGLFLLKALSALAPGGRLAFIMPSEFLNADYGVAVKRLLLASGQLRGIASFESNHLVFSNALTTACVVFAESPVRGAKPTHVLLARISSVSDLDQVVALLECTHATTGATPSPVIRELEATRWWPIDALQPERKWHGYLRPSASSIHDPGAVQLHTLGRCSRGIATGANSFFLLSASEVERLGLSPEELVRCIGRASDLQGPVITEEGFASLVARGRPTFLLSLRGRRPSAAAKAYIAKGEALGLHLRYLTRTRNRWYEAETRDPPDFFVSVFFRGRPKVVLNEAAVVSLTAFHGFYLDPMFRDAAAPIVRFLNTEEGAAALAIHRREYGGGLLKLEPRDVELAAIPRCLLDPKQ